MTRPLRRKTERIDLRTTEEQKHVIERAAQLRHTTASEFMLQAAYAEAMRLLEEESRLQLGQKAWQDFCAALDAPAKAIPALKEFLSQPDVFDAGTA